MPSHSMKSLAIAGVLAAALSMPAFAQSTTDTTPFQDAMSKVTQFKKNLETGRKQILEHAKTIGELTDATKATKEIEDLRAIVSGLLGDAADNGLVPQTVASALNFIEAEIKALEKSASISPERKEFLLREWRERQKQAKSWAAEIEKDRTKLVELLGKLQGDEDYLGQLTKLAIADKMIDELRKLATELRNVVNALDNVVSPPRGS